MDLGDAASAYAAFVATGALFLEGRRWFESGPRPRVSATPGMLEVGKTDGTKYLYVAIANCGDLPISVEAVYLASLRFPHWRRIPANPDFYYIKPNADRFTIPAIVESGHQWHGIIPHDADIDRMRAEDNLYVFTYYTYRKKPIVTRVRLPKTPVPLENLGMK